MNRSDIEEILSNWITEATADDLNDRCVELCEEHNLDLGNYCFSVGVTVDDADEPAKQVPICENYPSGTVLVLWPSGRVQSWPSLAKAKTFLFTHHQGYVACNVIEAHAMMRECPWLAEKWKVPAECEDLWQYLLDISIVRDPWMKAGDIPDSTRMTKRKTASGYIINNAKAIAFADVKAPKQAKVIAKIFSEFEDKSVVDDKNIESALHHAANQSVLVTKQPVMRIFSYYRKHLLDAGVITLRE